MPTSHPSRPIAHSSRPLLALMLLGGLVAAGAETPRATSVESILDPDGGFDRARVASVHALVERDAPGDAFAAALLLRSWQRDRRSSSDSALPSPAELLRHAEALAPHDPLVAWAAIAIGCGSGDAPCDPGATIQRLIDADPGNAYPWTLALADARRRNDEAGVVAALSNAARAKVYDDYLWTVDQRLMRALMSLPAPLFDRAMGEPDARDEAGNRLMVAIGATDTVEIPSFQPLGDACRPPVAGPGDPTLAADCTAVATMMMARESSLISWRVGLAIRKRWAIAPAESERLAASARGMRYLATRYSALAPTLRNSPAEAGGAIERRLRAKSELDYMASELRRAGIATEPPREWQDDDPEPPGPVY